MPSSADQYESSALDHRFGAGDGPYTMGVEEEYMLLDAKSLDHLAHAPRLTFNVAENRQGHGGLPGRGAGAGRDLELTGTPSAAKRLTVSAWDGA